MRIVVNLSKESLLVIAKSCFKIMISLAQKQISPNNIVYFIGRSTIFFESSLWSISLCFEHFGIVRLTQYNSHLFYLFFIIIILVLAFFHQISCTGSSNCGFSRPHLPFQSENFYGHTQINIWFHKLESVILWYINIFSFS